MALYRQPEWRNYQTDAQVLGTVLSISPAGPVTEIQLLKIKRLRSIFHLALQVTSGNWRHQVKNSVKRFKKQAVGLQLRAELRKNNHAKGFVNFIVSKNLAARTITC